jgi:thiol:disulfide interchange protein DsbD
VNGVTVGSGPARPEFAATADVGGAGAPGSGVVAGAPAEEAPLDLGSGTDGSSSLATFLFAAFGAGLLALLTPCVFPMIPVTLAFFTKQATAGGRDSAAARAGVVRLAGVYSLGIVLAFTAIGAVLAATVGASGANQLAANPWVNLAFALLFVLFGLALLEVVELRLPAGLQGLAGRGSRHGGTWGVLGMGLTFVIAAFTCTAPFVGTILVAASQASTGAQWFRPIVGMMAFATALALPFFLLALFPGWLARLPRSGAWLSTVKGAMGFVEIAAAFKFLSNADLVWQWKVLTEPVLLSLWALVAIATTFWLLGALRIGFGTPEGRPTFARRAWAGVFGAIALYCLWGLTGRPLNGWVAAFLPPEGYRFGASGVTSSSAERLSWHDTLEAGLVQARAENKPIFVDFTGYTCTNCRKMEKDVFPVPEVEAELSQFVRVKLYTDGQDAASQKNQAYQEETFGDVTLPLYAVLTADARPVARLGGLRSGDEFLRFLQEGRERVMPTRANRRPAGESADPAAAASAAEPSETASLARAR